MTGELLSCADFANEQESRRVLGDAGAGFLIQGERQGRRAILPQQVYGRRTDGSIGSTGVPAVAVIALGGRSPSSTGQRIGPANITPGGGSSQNVLVHS